MDLKFKTVLSLSPLLSPVRWTPFSQQSKDQRWKQGEDNFAQWTLALRAQLGCSASEQNSPLGSEHLVIWTVSVWPLGKRGGVSSLPDSEVLSEQVGLGRQGRGTGASLGWKGGKNGNSHPSCHLKGTRRPTGGAGACYGQASLVLSF